MWLQFLALVQHVSSKAARETTRFPGPLRLCRTQTGAKKLNFPGYKGSSEYHKRRDGDQAKKIQTLSCLLYQTEHAFSGWTETLSKCQQRWGACSSTAEISFWSQRESSALEMRDILALQWKGDNPQLFLSALLSCSDLLSNQIIRFAATSANTYSMKSLKHKR